MTVARFAFVVCLAGLLISLMILIVLHLLYLRSAPTLALLMTMGWPNKLGTILLVVMTVLSVTLATMHRLQRRRNDRLARNLRIIAPISIAVGLLGALYAYWWGIRNALWSVNEITFAMEAPSWAEAALMLALGFLPAVIALLGAAPVRVERRGL